MRSVLIFLLLLVLACGPQCSFAQSTNASISGTVVDPSNASIGSANVTLTDQQRGTATAVTTEPDGRFVFTIVQPGVYTVSVKQTGFKTYERRDINVSANDRLALGTITLPIGAVGETIEVQAQAIALQTEAANAPTRLSANKFKISR